MKKYYLLIPVVFVFLVSIWYVVNKPQKSNTVFDSNQKLLEVKVEGAVTFPNIYYVLSGTTTEEVIEISGGFLENADVSPINLLEKLTSNKTIKVAFLDNNITSKININTATLSVLMQVPGITEKRAASIIVYREQHGYFKKIEDLVNVKYIGNVTFDRIKEYVTV
ncbi:MAG: ComEA family DNA-binding protein [Acholeplasmatales bacterium]|nr:ComEA family DNA-binding protein [Acholeplasmatales bacterium]